MGNEEVEHTEEIDHETLFFSASSIDNDQQHGASINPRSLVLMTNFDVSLTTTNRGEQN